MSSQATSSSNQNNQAESSFKARQLISSGPQDFLYVSTSNSTNTSHTSNTNINETLNSSKASSLSIKNNEFIATKQNTSPIPSLIQQAGRIDSKSYTKIPEIINDSSKIIRIVDITNSEHNSNEYNPANGIPLSKSVIVTSSDKNNYSRMTRSSISRNNSKYLFLNLDFFKMKIK